MSRASPSAADRAGAAGDGDGSGRRRWRLGGEVGEVGAEGVEELAGDEALEAAEDLGLGFAFGEAALGVGAGACEIAQAAGGDLLHRAVGVAVAAVVAAVAVAAPGGHGNGAGAAEG